MAGTAHKTRLEAVMEDISADLSMDDFHYVIEGSMEAGVTPIREGVKVELIYGGLKYHLFLMED